jgi:rsbT co-antagonist protein RsbR
MNSIEAAKLQLFSRLLDSAPLVMFALDRDGIFTLCEGSGLAALGATPGQWVGQNGPESWKGTEAEPAMRRALAGEDVQTTVSIPGPRHYRVWYLAIRDEKGQPSGAYGLAFDVTEEREREKAMQQRMADLQAERAKTNLLQRAINAAPLTVWMLDRDGKIMLSEGGVLPKLGMKPGDSIGMNALEMYRGTMMEEQIRATLEGRPGAVSQEIMPGLYLDTWTVPMKEGEAVDGILGISIDSTERVQVERAIREKLEVIERQAATIRSLATPIIRVWDEILCLPVIGTVDSQRTAEMMNALLHAIAREQARFAIVDLTGVDVVDTSTADHLIRIFKAARVLGVEGVLCGIQPAVAQTVVALGMDLGEVHTKRTLQDALKWCLTRRGVVGAQSRAHAAPVAPQAAAPAPYLNGAAHARHS